MAFSSGTGIGVGFGAGNAGLGVAGNSGVGAGMGGSKGGGGPVGPTGAGFGSPKKSGFATKGLPPSQLNSIFGKFATDLIDPKSGKVVSKADIAAMTPKAFADLSKNPNTGVLGDPDSTLGQVIGGLGKAFELTHPFGMFMSLAKAFDGQGPFGDVLGLGFGEATGFGPQGNQGGPGFTPPATGSTFFPNGGLTADAVAAAPAASSPRESILNAIEGELRALQGGKNSAFLDSLALEAALADIERQRTEARADISRDQERRRIKGTPFANNLLAQSDREFEKQKAVVRAQAREAAIANMFRSIDLAFSQVNAGLNRELEELRIQTGANQATQAIAFSASQFEQEIAAREAAAEGAFFGSLASMLGQIIAGSQ